MSDESPRLLQPSNGRYLETTLTQKLIPSSERELNNTCEFCQLFGSVGFDIRNALETLSMVETKMGRKHTSK